MRPQSQVLGVRTSKSSSEGVVPARERLQLFLDTESSSQGKWKGSPEE